MDYVFCALSVFFSVLLVGQRQLCFVPDDVTSDTKVTKQKSEYSYSESIQIIY